MIRVDPEEALNTQGHAFQKGRKEKQKQKCTIAETVLMMWTQKLSGQYEFAHTKFNNEQYTFFVLSNLQSYSAITILIYL